MDRFFFSPNQIVMCGRVWHNQVPLVLKQTNVHTQTLVLQWGVIHPFLSIHIHLLLSNHHIFTDFLWAALSPPWIPKLGTSPSQRIVCLNWKVGRGKPTNVANHFKTTFHLFPSFFFISLSIIFIRHAVWEGPFIWERGRRRAKWRDGRGKKKK